jgi:hypothetical protein
MNRPFLVLPVLVIACSNPPNGPKGGNAIGLAVVGGDYKSTVISLVDAANDLLAQDDCIDSGAVTPTLSMALSGDIVLASQTQPNNDLLLIDRTNSALDWIAPTTCGVQRQLSVATGFYSNPHDVVGLSASKAYVTRFETNPTPSGVAGANDLGDDILIIDPAAGGITGRIDLSPLASQIAGATIQSRPDRAFLANGKVYVTLANSSADFKTVGPGRVAIIDPGSDTVTGTIDLPDYKDCAGLDYIDASKTLIIGCGGDYNDSLANQTAQSALVLVDIGAATPRVVKAITGAVVGARPVAASVFAVAGDNLVFVATAGDSSGTPTDALWAVTLDTGAASKVIDGDESFAFSGLAWSATTKQVYLTDAATILPLVRVFDVSVATAIHQVSAFDANPKSGLPPRQIGWY